jgi:DNA-binding SARP family transcriptional activator/tetratricopeptide (TPR) repeat protein
MTLWSLQAARESVLAGRQRRSAELESPAGTLVGSPTNPRNPTESRRRVLEIRLLGPLELRVDDSLMALPALKPRLALICLATSPGYTATIGELSDAVWGDEPPHGALNSLHVYISNLRRLLGPESVLSQGQTYSLDPSTVVDFERFEHEVGAGVQALERQDDVAAAAWLARALARWSGQPLGSEGDSEFVVALRSAAIDSWLRALEAWSDVRTRTGHPAEVVSRLAEPVLRHPYREVLRARYILALGASGRQVEALAEYRSARTNMRTELGVEPSQYLADAQSAVLRGDFPLSDVLVTSAIRLGLSLPVGTLVGRERELEALERLSSNPGVRMVSVLGHGGIGKTRLVQELVRQHPDHSAFVSLALAEPGDDLAKRICAELGLGEGADPLNVLTAALSSSAEEIVLVLDNLEHLPAASEVIGQIIVGAPLVTVVATSRIPLRVPGERRLTLGALEVTSTDGQLPPAGEMLLDRVWAYNETFVPSVSELTDAVAIAQLCEGVPLSIEMLAARASVFTLAELRKRLEQSLVGLISASDGDFGTESTGAVVRWSISLLNPMARAALATASTFSGGFTAIALAGVLGEDLDSAAEPMRILVEYALITSTAGDGTRRFDMLEVIRAVIQAELSDEEVAELRHRHAVYFRSTLDGGDRNAFFPSKISELTSIGAERSNYRRAVRTALRDDRALAGGLIDALGVAWMRVGSPQELKEWIDALLATASVSPELRMACLIHLLRVDQMQGNIDSASIFLRLHAVERDVTDSNLLSSLFAYRAIYASDRADAGEAAEALAQLDALPQNQIVAYWRSVARLSLLVITEDDEAAIDELTSFLRWAKPAGLELHSLSATQNLIYALMSSGRHAAAADLAMQQLEVVTDSDVMSRIVLLQESGEAFLWMGQIDPAITNLEMAVALAQKFGSDRLVGDALLRLAAARVKAQPDDADGAFLAGMALAWVEQSAIELDHSERLIVTQFLHEVQQAADGTPLAASRMLGEQAFATIGLVAGAEVASHR